ncbi:MFS transporter [Halomarina halobia]|uniref:MFS transporter n=1 Tax=Halomarina halobia TaxID=3033386 RepID=A0ABD6ADS6_9EURY|nr:MFS transporter [Halomarina sp. PSR21]
MQARTRTLFVTCVSLLLSVLVWFNYSAVLPLIADEWGLSGTEAGIVFGSFQAGYLLAIIPMGHLADRHSPRVVIGFGAATTGLLSVTFGLVASGFLSGSVLRFFAGVGMAGVYVPGMRFLSDWYPTEDRGRAMGMYVGSYSLASGLSFLFATAVADAVDWRAAIVVTSIGALAVAPLMLGLTRDHPSQSTADRSGFDLTVLRNRAYLWSVSVYSWHTWELFGMRNWMLAFLLTVPAVVVVDSGAFAGVLVGVTMAVGGFGNLIGGHLSDRVGRLPTIGTALAVSGLISAVFGFLGALPLWAIVPVLLVYGTALTADSAPTSTMVTEVVDDGHVGTALALQSFVGFAASVVSPIAFGVALDRGGYVVAFLTLAIGGALGLLSLALLRLRTDAATDTV